METTHELLRRKSKERRKRLRYDAAYRATRALVARYVAAGQAKCVRCHQLIEPGTKWDLGHDDRTGAIKGPEHQACNRGAPHRNVTSRVW